MKNHPVLVFAAAVVMAVMYGFVMRLFFDMTDINDLYTLMSWTFLVGAPGIMGYITIRFSPEDYVRQRWYRILAPWVPIFLYFIGTFFFNIEGWACWIMVLPLFLISSSIGGLLGRKRREKANGRLYVSLVVLLPLFIGPIEHFIGALPGTYEAYTYIDIHAPAERIWANVTRVPEIPASEDRGWLTRNLSFPRPVRAELNYNGVGGHREAVFTNGLTFHEQVLEYDDLKKMVFTIKAYPYEIPSTTMDKHVVIGGDYFDVLNGTYRMERLGEDHYRLHLYSHFVLRTTFNFYASHWAGWIMKDIQNNILHVIKDRAEGTAKMPA